MNQKYKNIIKATEKSGEIVLSYFNKGLKIQSKGEPLNFVTEADLKSEKNLRFNRTFKGLIFNLCRLIIHK